MNAMGSPWAQLPLARTTNEEWEGHRQYANDDCPSSEPGPEVSDAAGVGGKKTLMVAGIVDGTNVGLAGVRRSVTRRI